MHCSKCEVKQNGPLCVRVFLLFLYCYSILILLFTFSFSFAFSFCQSICFLSTIRMTVIVRNAKTWQPYRIAFILHFRKQRTGHQVSGYCRVSSRTLEKFSNFGTFMFCCFFTVLIQSWISPNAGRCTSMSTLLV